MALVPLPRGVGVDGRLRAGGWQGRTSGQDREEERGEEREEETEYGPAAALD